MNKKTQTIKYIFSDYCTSTIVWIIFFNFRKIYIENSSTEIKLFFSDKNFLLGIIFIPILWILIHYITGYYHDIYRKARLKELYQTFIVSIFGVLIIFFELILDDIINSYKDYYQSIIVLLFLQFFLTYIPRLLITSAMIKKINNRKIGFKTILVGENGKSAKIYHEIQSLKKSVGNIFVGYISSERKKNAELEKEIPYLGTFDNLYDTITENNIEEVIIAIESSKHDTIQKILNKLFMTNVRVKILPSDFDIYSRYVNLVTQYKTPLIEIQNRNMSIAEENLKRIMDISTSIIAIIITLPLFIVVAIGVKLSSKGPIFYHQERIGKAGKPFQIIKFRTMFVDSEKNGPALSSTNDPRVTKFGRLLRKTRIDEIPQFYNVLFGQMSIVGPRPERQFYIDKIVQKSSYYMLLLKVKPGITSLGQVKYGYAENVDQMIERTKFDLVYLQKMSLYLDLKIMILTVKTIFEASGK